MKVNIKTIPHAKQRYDTVGDWWEEGDTVQIRVSVMDNMWYEHLVAIHEYCEWLLCKEKGISEQAVTEFDKRLLDVRRHYPGTSFCELGDAPAAPYREQHCIATGIERILCAALGLSWSRHDDAVTKLSQTQSLLRSTPPTGP